MNAAIAFGAGINRDARRNRNRTCGDSEVRIRCTRWNENGKRRPNETGVAAYQANSYASGRRGRLQSNGASKRSSTDDTLVTKFHSIEDRKDAE